MTARRQTARCEGTHGPRRRVVVIASVRAMKCERCGALLSVVGATGKTKPDLEALAREMARADGIQPLRTRTHHDR